MFPEADVVLTMLAILFGTPIAMIATYLSLAALEKGIAALVGRSRERLDD